MREYNYMMAATYCKNWTVQEAIRELIANAIDTGKAVDVKWSDTGMAMIRDYGDGMAAKALLLGESTKSEKDIGQFGEGLKIAALVLARNGYGLTVRSNGNVYRFSLKHSEDFGAGILTVSVEDVPELEDHVKGTLCEFKCYERELEETKALFLKFADVQKYAFSDRILKAPGMVYVKGLLTTKVDSMFGYNLVDKSLMNRDRSVIDGSRLEQLVAAALNYCQDEEVIEQYIRGMFDPDTVSKYEYRAYVRPQHLDVWKKVIKIVLGAKICYSTGAADGRAKYLGYTVVKPRCQPGAYVLQAAGVKSAEEVAPEPPKKPVNVTVKDLAKEEERVLELAKKIGKKVCTKPGWWVQVTDNKESVAGTECNGKIEIEKRQLKSLEAAVGTMLHELAHYESGGSDVTAHFEAKLTTYLGRVGALLAAKVEKIEKAD